MPESLLMGGSLAYGIHAGGDLHVTLDVKDMLRDGVWPDLDAKVFGKNLHGPLIDRILELPMDIHEGRANGYIQIRAFDTKTWLFPRIDGNIRCKSKYLKLRTVSTMPIFPRAGLNRTKYPPAQQAHRFCF